MKSAEPCTRTSKRSRGEASTKAPTSSAMPTAEETFLDPTTTVDPSGGAEDVDPTVAPPLSLHYDAVFHDYTSCSWTASR